MNFNHFLLPNHIKFKEMIYKILREVILYLIKQYRD